MPFPTRPDSIRGRRQGLTIDKPETGVAAPSWLSKEEKKEFRKLVHDLVAANVPVKQVDSFAIASCAQCIANVAKWTREEQKAQSLKDKLDCSKQIARYSRDAQKWLQELCATPYSRSRIGVKSSDKKEGAVARLLAMKKNAQ